MRKFFQEIKADLKFKSAGPGQKLAEPPRCGAGSWGGTTKPPSGSSEGAAGSG